MRAGSPDSCANNSCLASQTHPFRSQRTVGQSDCSTKSEAASRTRSIESAPLNDTKVPTTFDRQRWRLATTLVRGIMVKNVSNGTSCGRDQRQRLGNGEKHT